MTEVDYTEHMNEHMSMLVELLTDAMAEALTEDERIEADKCWEMANVMEKKARTFALASIADSLVTLAAAALFMIEKHYGSEFNLNDKGA